MRWADLGLSSSRCDFDSKFSGVRQRIRPELTDEPIWLLRPVRTRWQAFELCRIRSADESPGNMVRNSLQNSPLNQTDLAVRRRFDITERVKLDCRVEYFNIFNHPNVALNPNNLFNPGRASTPGTVSWGWASKTQDNYYAGGYPGNMNGSGGLSSQYSVGGPRSGQLTLKISF